MPENLQKAPTSPWLPWMRELSSAKEHSLQYPAYRTGVGTGRETRLQASPWWRGNFLRMLNAGREWRDPAILDLDPDDKEVLDLRTLGVRFNELPRLLQLPFGDFGAARE